MQEGCALIDTAVLNFSDGAVELLDRDAQDYVSNRIIWSWLTIQCKYAATYDIVFGRTLFEIVQVLYSLSWLTIQCKYAATYDIVFGRTLFEIVQVL